jgi:REP element-mobilizing transposase RayT
MNTVAIHLVWNTYMTWPPGDDRGHWSALFDLYGHLTGQGHQLNLPDPVTVEIAKSLAKEPERVLTELDRQIIAETIGAVVTEYQVPVYAAAIERTHVHLLLGPTDEPIENLVGRIKGRSSSQVIKRGSEPGRGRTWTTGYWAVFVYDLGAIPTIQNYTEEHNRRKGLAYAPYEWIIPFVP